MDTAEVPVRPAECGVEAIVATAFGDESQPDGLVAVVGRER